MYLVEVLMEDMPVVVEQFLYKSEDAAKTKARSLVDGGEDENDVRVSRIRVSDAEESLRAPKPDFNYSELLSIYAMAGVIDRENPGWVSAEDLSPIREKVNEWYKLMAPGLELR